MLITRARIRNYKSYLDSGEIFLTPGFNVIIGRNDVGKTALIEALSLRFENHSHRSPITVPYPGASISPTSTVDMVFSVLPSEMEQLIASMGQDVRLTIDPNIPLEVAAGRFIDSLTAPAELRTTYQEHSFLRAILPAICADESSTRGMLLEYRRQTRTFRPDIPNVATMGAPNGWAFNLATLLRNRIYAFRAERLNIAESGISNDPNLQPNAANLAQVIQLLQSSNVERFRRFNEYVSAVFPHIKQVTAPPVSNGTAHVLLWSIDPATERDDLAISLAHSGTGIGQVLAILYVVVTAVHPRIILIDEPQSFLHPGATRTLLHILQQHPQHQFIITTHSPAAVLAAEPSTILLAQRGDSGTDLTTVDRKAADDLTTILLDVGARLSDVFGSDEILWVEGKTEERCFPFLIEHFLSKTRSSIQVLGVSRTSDFGRRDIDRTLEIYLQLTNGPTILPRAVAFIFDAEGLREEDQAEIKSRSNGIVHFLGRRMYENYLLTPAAIADVIHRLLD